MSKYHLPLQSGVLYHLFNRAIGNELIFRCHENFQYFIKKYYFHTEIICDTFCYTLMPNHFHFVVKIKSREEILKQLQQVKAGSFDPEKHDLSDFIMERLSNFFNGYAKAFNKMYNRKGSLFIDYMKRVYVPDKLYLVNLINYIHYNPVKHGFCKNPLDWKWTSLHEFLGLYSQKIPLNEVIGHFGTFEDFKSWHGKMVEELPEYEFLL